MPQISVASNGRSMVFIQSTMTPAARKRQPNQSARSFWCAQIKEILYRAANRNDIDLVLIANQALKVPGSERIRTIQVEAGFDMGDKWIGQRVKEIDLVITPDIPLAAEVIDNGAQTLVPRGDLYTRDNIRQRLSMRDFMDTLRDSGSDTGGPQTLIQADRKAFADQLNRLPGG